MSYVRVGINGTFTGGEVWSINPVFDPTGEFPGTVNQAALDAAAQAIADLAIPGALKQALTASGTRTGARVEVRDDATDNLIGLSVAGSLTSGVGGGAVNAPFQTALVTSLRTDSPGRSGRGRLYWPAMGVTLSANGRLSTPVPATFAADMKTYLNGMAGALAAAFPLIGFNLAVRSKTTLTTPHVVRLQVGDVLDTQRRRRDALPEAYVSVSM